MKVLTRYAKKRLKRLRILLNSSRESHDLEMLHRMRLEIKKIKTLLGLIQYNHKSFKARSSFIPFRTIFRACGRIREPQIMNALIAKFTVDAKLPDLNLSIPIRQFVDEIPSYHRNLKKQGKILLKEIEKVKSCAYKRYLRKKNKELKRCLLPTFKVEELHTMRKLMKDIYYLLRIKNQKQLIDRFFKQSDALIGSWHDKAIVIHTIRKSNPSQTEIGRAHV